jgi:hypothetical protein
MALKRYGNLSFRTLERTYRLPRLWSNHVLREIAHSFTGEIINVSGWNDADKEGGCYSDYFMNASSYYLSNHTGERGLSDSSERTDFMIDLSTPVPGDLKDRFDVVFNHTTLEHIYEIRTAFRNLCLMSRDIVIIIVPFAQEMHSTDSFGDYWRFTPMSLRRLFNENNYSVVFEAISPFKNAGIYLFFAGSRSPQKWKDKMPEWHEVSEAGGWIGHNRLQVLKNYFTRMKNIFKSR